MVQEELVAQRNMEKIGKTWKNLVYLRQNTEMDIKETEMTFFSGDFMCSQH